MSDRLQLEKTLAVLKSKAAVLEEELQAEKNQAEGGLFETDEPEHQRHVVSYFRSTSTTSSFWP